MGLLDDLLGGMLGGQMGQGRAAPVPPRGSPGSGGGTSNVLMALLPVLLSMLASRGGGTGQTGGGGLGDILGQVLGGGAPRGGGGGGRGDDVLGEMFGSRGGSGSIGGLGALLQQMQQAGFGDQARSWVGTGQNMPITPDVLGQIFGQRGIDEIARQAGLTPRQTSEGLSQLLPEVVDRVTPSGEVPDMDQLTMSVDDLRRRLGV
jgi:uncharacterized protein YidB (DUF937 family)